MRDGDGDEEEEEVLRDEEVMFQCDIKLIIQADELERHLSEGSRQSNGSDPPSFDLTSSPTLPASHRVHTPASTDIRHRPRPVQHKSSSNAPLSPLALHTTSSAIFDHPGIPPLSRRTTYSSLPPSPGLEIDLDFSRGVGKQELEEVLERLNAKAGPATARLQDVKKKGEESWSVRPTSETANVGNAGQGDGTRSDSPEGKKRVEASGIWDLLKDELGAEDWDGWVVDGKWYASPCYS